MENFSEEGKKYIGYLEEKIAPEDKESLRRIIIAGKKIMFSKQTHKYMIQMLEKQGDLSEKLGVGMVELMGLVFQHSQGNLKLQLLVPAGSILLVSAGEYVDKTQGGMTMDIFSEANKIMSAGIKKQVEDGVARQGSQPGGAQPTQPNQMQPQSTPPAGLIAGQGV